MTQITLEAPDISCDHCIASIEKALARLTGVQFLSGDPAAKQVIVEYDPALVELVAIESAMEDEGYPVKR
jgi:copper chaperone CopZ